VKARINLLWKVFVLLLVQNYEVTSTIDILHSLKTKPRHKEQAAREWRSLLRQSRFSIAFLLLHFPSNLSVSRISAEVRALWIARVSSTPLFPLYVFHSVVFVPRVSRSARRDGNFQSQLPPPSVVSPHTERQAWGNLTECRINENYHER